MSTAIKSVEIYDPATGVWVATNSLNVGRYEAAAALLPNGNVLVAGGLTIPGNDTDSEVFDTGLSFSNAWRPQVTNINVSPALDAPVVLGGALFRGGSEGSGGNGSQDSAADYPLVQLRALESGESIFLTVTNWATNALATVALTNFPQGWALETVFVDGVPSQSGIVNVSKPVATVILSNLTQYYDGAAESVSVTTVPAGLTVSVTYNGSSSPPTNVGSYTVVATVVDTNFKGGATNTMQILAENRNFGVDVSHFQDSSGIPETNWTQMFTGGDRFVFCKASEGLTGPDDPTMATNVANALQAGFLVGVYHYAHPENRPTTNGAVVEADHLLSYASNAIAPGMLRPVIDIETGAGVLSPTQMSDWVLAFSQEIVNNRGNGAAPMVYCTQNYANTNFDNQVATTALWLEAPNGTNEIYGNPPANGFTNATGMFNNWAFWQYGIGSAGGISPIDLDVCHDEFAPLVSYLIPTATPAFRFASLNFNSSTGFQLSFTNVPGTHFTLLSSTNAALALSNWTVVATATEISPGQFQITDPGATNLPLRFYRVRSP
jgi:GH25 family lysozyme M1 (1,4-beta-N-acetylmuramidase)